MNSKLINTIPGDRTTPPFPARRPRGRRILTAPGRARSHLGSGISSTMTAGLRF